VSRALSFCMCCRLQTASEGTLEEAEGVYLSTQGPSEPPTAECSMARFTMLRRLWLRQFSCNMFEGVELDLPPSLRCSAAPHSLTVLVVSAGAMNHSEYVELGSGAQQVCSACDTALSLFPVGLPTCADQVTINSPVPAACLPVGACGAAPVAFHIRLLNFCRDLVLDAAPNADSDNNYGVISPVEWPELGTALTRLEFRGYSTRDYHNEDWKPVGDANTKPPLSPSRCGL